MKNYADLGGCYPPQPSASADNTLLDLHNSSYHTQPHPIIANYSDIDECAVSNGGCSHKCVNTAGGYKCECPDPELSLSLDNKTCHG